MSLIITQNAYAGKVYNYETGVGDFCVTIQEEDGSPSSICPDTIKFPSGNITDNGDGSFSIADNTSVGGGNSVYVSEDAVAVFNNSSADMTMNFDVGLDWSGSGQLRTLGLDPSEKLANATTNGFIPATSMASIDALVAVSHDVSTINGILKGDGAGNISAATAGTDYLTEISQDTTPQLGGELDAQGNNIIDLADVTFKTGAVGGALRTGTSNADKFILEAYDVDDGVYRNVYEIDAGNTVTHEFNEAGIDMDFRVEGVGQANAFFVQGSDGAVGIRNGAPSEALDVTGNIAVSGTVDGKDIATNAGMLNEAETISADWVNTANPWADNEVSDTITVGASGSVDDGAIPSGITRDTEWDTLAEINTATTDTDAVASDGSVAFTAEQTVDDLGLEFTAGDSLTDCSTYSATGGGIFYDDSEGKFKKCQDNTLTDLDTGGAEVNALESDGASGIADTEVFIGTGAGTGNYAALSGDVTMANTGATTIGNDKILESMLKAVDAAVDEECLTYESTTGDFEWQTCGSGSDTNAIWEKIWPASATLPVEVGDSIAPIIKDAGTNSDNLVVGFDGSTDECRTITFAVPQDVDTSGNSATFEAVWYDPAGSTASTAWDVRWHEVTDGEVWDGTLTTDSVGSCTPAAGTADLVDVCTGTETFANLGWAAGDVILMQVCRDANGTNQTDSSTADSYLLEFRVRMPRA